MRSRKRAQRTEGITDDLLPGLLHAGLDELVVDLLVDVQTGASAAALALSMKNMSFESKLQHRVGACLVEEETQVGDLNGLFNISVIEDHERRLATKLKSDVLEVALASRHLRCEGIRTFVGGDRIGRERTMMIRPTSVEPVKATLSMSMCSLMAAPAVGP